MIRSLFWKYLERVITQIVSFATSVVLARLLEPEYFGLITSILIFVNIAEIFVNDGLSASLIQKKEPDAADYSTVLITNTIVSSALYILLFFYAPFILRFFRINTDLSVIFLRIISLRIIFSGIHSVQQAYISKKMMFHELFIVSSIATILSSTISLVMAFNQMGIWTLVVQNLVYTIIISLILLFVIGKIPSLSFSKNSFKQLYRFGSETLATSMLIQGFEQFQLLLIKSAFSSADLAYYDKGKHYPYLLVNNINASVSSVFFPYASSRQDDKRKIKELTKQNLRFSSYVICPMMLGLYSIAEPFVSVLLTDKWLPSVPILKAFCIIYLFYPLHFVNNQATRAIGRSDICLRIEIIKKVIGIVVFLMTIKYGILYIAYGMVFRTILGSFLDAYPNSRLFDYSVKEQLSDFLSSFILAVGMTAIVSLISFMHLKPFASMLAKMASGILAYLILSILTKNKEFRYILNRMKTFHQ